jgi:MFS family permease
MTWDPRQPGAGQPAQSPVPIPPPPLPYANYPPGAYPPQMLGYQQPVAVVRPTAVTVLAIFGIVLASLWMLMGLGSGVSLVVLFSFMGSAFPPMSQLAGFRAVMIWSTVSGVVGALIGVVLLAASIGCLRMRPWGRTWMIRYAIADLAWVGIKFVVTVAWILPMQRTWATAPLPGPATAPAPATTAPTTTGSSPGARAPATATRTPLAAVYFGGVAPDDPIVQSCLAGVLAVIYPVAVLFYMTRPRIKGAFTPVAPAELVE